MARVSLWHQLEVQDVYSPEVLLHPHVNSESGMFSARQKLLMFSQYTGQKRAINRSSRGPIYELIKNSQTFDIN